MKVRTKAEAGFTYLWVLFAIALLGVMLTVVSELWWATARRQKNEQLEWVGEQFRLAIGSYYEASPGSVKVYPLTAQDLLEDRRYLTLRRHLRTIYVNPFTGKADWDWVQGSDGRLHGVRVAGQGDEPAREFVYQPMSSGAVGRR